VSATIAANSELKGEPMSSSDFLAQSKFIIFESLFGIKNHFHHIYLDVDFRYFYVGLWPLLVCLV